MDSLDKWEIKTILGLIGPIVKSDLAEERVSAKFELHQEILREIPRIHTIDGMSVTDRTYVLECLRKLRVTTPKDPSHAFYFSRIHDKFGDRGVFLEYDFDPCFCARVMGTSPFSVRAIDMCDWNQTWDIGVNMECFPGWPHRKIRKAERCDWDKFRIS